MKLNIIEPSLLKELGFLLKRDPNYTISKYSEIKVSNIAFIFLKNSSK